MVNKSVVRHPKLSALIEQLSGEFPRLEEIIDGALWEISKSPQKHGTFNADLQIWMARLAYPPVILMYTINPRYIHALTFITWDD